VSLFKNSILFHYIIHCLNGSEWRIVFAFIFSTLDNRSHLVLELEIWELRLENFFALGDDGVVLSAVRVRVEWLASKHPLLLHLPEAEGEAAMNDSDVLVISVENIVWTPDWLPFGELDTECALMLLWVVLLGLTLNAISWSESSILLEVGLRIIDADEAIISLGVESHYALTIFLGLSISSMKLIPSTKILFNIKVLLNRGLWATLPESLFIGEIDWSLLYLHFSRRESLLFCELLRLNLF